MRQMVVAPAEEREWGRKILLGLRRAVSEMCFLVVRMSHREMVASSDRSEGSGASRFFFEDWACSVSISDLMCLSKAVDAWETCQALLDGN